MTKNSHRTETVNTLRTDQWRATEMAGNPELRRRLSNFTALNCPDPCRCEDWPGRLASITQEISNNISVVSIRPEPNYNCITFALGLHESKKHYWINFYSRYRAGEQTAFADTEFLLSLLKSRAIAAKDVSLRQGMIVYFDDAGVPQHAGHLSGHRVRSKWGECWLVDHDLWEVPADYGNHFKLYEHPDTQQMEAKFLEWAENVRHVDTSLILSRIRDLRT